QRQWDRDIEGVQTPWVAGDFIYLVTTRAEVVCLSRRDGRIRWVRQLERYKDPKDRKNPIEWVGPVLISDRLVVAGSNGYAVSVSPYTGKILGRIELPDAVRIAPVVADGTLYFLTDDADLIAYR
ncbi:MAG TPA: PQQ-binding-like beta-propeller repeat protein, partial [Alphaproteobacteria bacterium]|nr:PQQ-binding-like beta-propeller repeat protein [Alphaproteobacteria bacterium]